MADVHALLDSNVVVAIVALRHERHESSAALFANGSATRFAIAAHSYAEAYTTLTRRSAASAFRWPPEVAWQALESVASATVLAGLTPVETFDAVCSYAAIAGVGPRIYDRLIGEVAVKARIPRIVTWNVGHMRSLFPALEIVTPAEAIA